MPINYIYVHATYDEYFHIIPLVIISKKIYSGDTRNYFIINKKRKIKEKIFTDLPI